MVSVLLAEETGVPGLNHRPAARHFQTLSHNVVLSTPHLSGIRTHNIHVSAMYCSKEKMFGSACTSSHSSRCLNKSGWSGDYMYLGDVIPSSGLTIILIANFYALSIFR
jgi:hypothetical protein